MKIDLKTYSINRKFIQNWYKNNKDKSLDIGTIVSLCASATHCPCIALAHYLAEDIGYIPELTGLIDGFIKFYGYTEVLGQKEGSPYLTKTMPSDIK
jgi:hypothetical protein